MRRSPLLAALSAAAGGLLAVTLLTGCDGPATTKNAVTPGPPLPEGVSAPPSFGQQRLPLAPNEP